MINKIINYFGIDGLAHIIVCNVLVSIIAIIIPLWIAVIITIIIALGKEYIYDKKLGKGTCEIKDLIADGIGIIIGCL